MRLNENLLERCEEFFDLIANQERCEELGEAVDSLREFLEKDVDGWSNLSEGDLAHAVQCRLKEVWRLLSRNEKAANSELGEYYEDLLQELGSFTDYEPIEDDEEWA